MSSRSTVARLFVGAVVGVLLSWPAVTLAQTAGQTPPAPVAGDVPQAPPPAEEPARSPQFFETVTVSSTLNPATVRDTPGTVSVIDADTIQRRLIENVADLVKFEPGVYIDASLTRGGLNGFNIRGIGGNRVMTQVDGVETSEQFDFGPFNVHQVGLDLDALKSAEIVRSAGSSLYGSDALGGVVSFFTKDPADYLAPNRRFHFGVKTLFDGRTRDAGGNVVVAGGRPRAQGSLFVSVGRGHEMANRGSIEAENATRTSPNPQDRRNVQVMAKTVLTSNADNVLRAGVEVADNAIETQAFTSRAITGATNVADVWSDDTMKRRRVSLDQRLVNWGGLNQWSWQLYAQQSETRQVVDEVRITSTAGGAVTINRSGTLDYDQDTFGGALQGRKAFAPRGQAVLFTFGASYKHDQFDMIRDRLDRDAGSGAVIPAAGLILPTKYFPESSVGVAGTYVQAEMRLGRLTVVPGVRYDRFSLDADEQDAVFLASLSPAAADFSADATSGKLGAAFQVSNALTVHAQYAGGFRAPPYSAVNSGFTNVAGGYTSVPNTNLDAETSDNLEAGARTEVGRVSFGVTGFWNTFDNFILQVQRGVSAAGLLEFQYQNVSKVKIRGIELQGEAQLAEGLRLRASYARVRGDDVSASADVPLNTIAPNQGVAGLQYTGRGNRWGSDVTVRATAGQSQATAGTGLFAPEGFAVADLFGWLAVGKDVTVRGGVLNLTDAKYFEWPNVRGRSATDPVLDRYSSPGVSAVVSLSYGW